MYAAGGRRSAPARDLAEGDGVDGDVLDPFRAGVLRTSQLRPAVQVVPGHAHRPARFRREPRSRRTANASCRRRSLTSSSPRSCARSSPPLRVERSLLRRRDPAQRVGVAEELQAEDGPPSEPPTGRNSEIQWHGQKRSNDTHVSSTDPEARLYRKSHNTAATLCYSGHLLMEHRSALIVDAELTTADGYAERATAVEMLARLPKTARRRTVAGDKGYDTRGSSPTPACFPLVFQPGSCGRGRFIRRRRGRRRRRR